MQEGRGGEESLGGGSNERGEGREVVKGRKVSLGLDLINYYEQHKPSAGASLNVAQRATSRLVIKKIIKRHKNPPEIN